MGKRLLIALILAIVATHVFVVWLVLKTNEAEKVISGEAEEEKTENVSSSSEASSDKKSAVTDDKTEETLSAGKDAVKSVAASKEEKKQDDKAQKAEKKQEKPFRPSETLSPAVHPVRTFTVNAKGARTGTLSAVPLTANASAGILAEYTGGTSFKVLWQKNPDKQVPIASLSKIMTLLIVGEMVSDKNSDITYDTKIPVTSAATKVPASHVWMGVGESFTLEELMLAASVRSANDAAFLMAQYAGGGKVENFVKMMNERAKGLGMTDTVFFNPHGLPGKKKELDNHSSVKEIMYLCSEFMRHDELMKWAATRTGTFRPGSKRAVQMQNHNHLLPGGRNSTPGVNGIKTGFTTRAGYCVAVSCVRNGRTFILVVTGFQKLKERDKCASALIEWGFKN